MAIELLLCKNVEHLGIVGDVVKVSPGYARNYLLPHGLATEPTKGNMRRLAEARKSAEKDRAEHRTRMEALAERLKDVEITIQAKANEEGALYGSVGRRDVAHALEAEGYFVKPENVILDPPIRHLDNVSIDIRLADDLRTPIKLWIVREKAPGEEEEETAKKTEARTEAKGHDEGAR